MANEAGPLTVNAAGTSWVDVTPGAVSTGYQAQNTNIEAGRVGMDATHVEASGGDAILRVSGPVDVDGVLYSIESEVTLSPADGTWYILLTAGTGDDLTPTTSASKGSWVSAKNGLYLSGERVLNWVLERSGGVMTVSRYLYDGDIVTTTATQTISGDKSFDGALFPKTDPTLGSQTISGSGGAYTPPRGLYNASYGAASRGGTFTDDTSNFSGLSGSQGGPYSGTTDTQVRNGDISSTGWSYAKF